MLSTKKSIIFWNGLDKKHRRHTESFALFIKTVQKIKLLQYLAIILVGADSAENKALIDSL